MRSSLLKSGSFTFDWEQINANTFLLEVFVILLYLCIFKEWKEVVGAK